jgi:tetratricopeptide (TPR) repeat protein
MHGLRRRGDRLAGLGLLLGTGLAAWTAASPVLVGQEAGSGPIPPMTIDSGTVVTVAAIAGFRERSEDPGRPVDWFNLGAGLLLTGDWEGAVEPTQRALEADDDELERAATYNLALARALAGRPPELGGELLFEERRPLLEQAWDGFRWVLRQDPEARDARWNLELVARWLEQEDDPQDDGGGGGGGGSTNADQTNTPSTRELSAAEALDLLDVAAEQEKDVQGRRLERNRSRDPVVEKNW